MAQAANDAYGDGLYGSCTYSSCGIGLTTNGTISLNVTPNGSTTCSVASDSVAVLTDSSTGYTLTFNDSATISNLTTGTYNIPTSSGTAASPVALAADTWGYRVDGLSGFGAGPTSGGTNIGIPAVNFAGIPNSTLPANTLATSASPANPAVTTNVWYGVCADLAIPATTYTSTVLYTAVVN
jgi:hypothetical protein